MENNILHSNIQSTICGSIMKLEKNSHYLDDCVFWCRASASKHDIKVNILKNSTFIYLIWNISNFVRVNLFIYMIDLHYFYILFFLFWEKLKYSYGKINNTALIWKKVILNWIKRNTLRKKNKYTIGRGDYRGV